MITASELTFGVEIETTVPAGQLHVGRYYGGGNQVPYLPQGWVCKKDSSIHTTPQRCGAEVVSPVLKGAAGLRQVVEVCRVLEAHNHRVNASCGVHVHVGWAEHGEAALAKLVSLTGHLEPGLFAITGTHRRETGIYCGGIKKHGSSSEACKQIKSLRYHVLNLVNIATGRQPTVEFRVFSGSTSGLKIVAWIMICLGIVEMALSMKKNARFLRKAKMTRAKSGGWYRRTPGCTAASYLVHRLGWNRGLVSRPYGLIAGDGVPTAKECKKELARLAKKYDSSTQPEAATA